LGGPKPLTGGIRRVRNFHLKDPKWVPALDTIAADIERAVHAGGALMATDNFNLKPFFDRGGKLPLWHGWDDPQVPALNSIRYYENVVQKLGGSAENAMALFLLPGVLHCARGGDSGPNTFDHQAAIEQWVEPGEKPARLVASLMDKGQIGRTRPLCPYSQVAHCPGKGSTDDEANFVCRAESRLAR
jgi:feruloyl esterase